MATTNANESRAKDNFVGMKGRTDYRGGYNNRTSDNGNKPRDNYFKTKENDYRTRESNYKTKENDYKTKENNYRTKDNNSLPGENTYRPKENSVRSSNESSRNFEYRPKDNNFGRRDSSFRPRDNNTKQTNSFTGREKNSSFTEHSRNSFSYQSKPDKDEDNDIKNTRGRKPAESKARSSMTKELEQTDKLDTIKRLEREKKAVQKKNREEEIEKPKRPALKQKRGTKDWTKDYEFGLLDEEDVF